MKVYHLTDSEIDRDYNRSIVMQQRDIDRLTLALTVRDTEVAELRREIDALHAQVARLTRKPAPWYLVALAALACLWAAYARAWRRWPCALAYLTTTALVVAAIAVLRWIGGL